MKSNKLLDSIYKSLGGIWATIFLSILALLFVVLVIVVLGFIYVMFELIQDAMPILIAFAIGYLLGRLTR